MDSRDIADEILAAAAGMTTRRALLEAGVHRNWITRQLATDRLTEPLPGVVALPGLETGLRDRMRAALLYAGPDAALSNATAAHLWDLVEAPDDRDPIQVAVPHGRRSKPGHRNAVVVHQRAHEPVMLRSGLPVVPPAEALRAMAADVGLDDLRFAALEAVRTGLVVPGELTQRALPGSLPALRLVAEEARAGAISGGEAKYWRLLKDAGLALPELNAEVVTDSGSFWVDALWRDHALGAEIDGRSVHALEQAFEADRMRQNAIQTAGVMLIRFPVSHVLLDGPAVLHQTAAALWARGRERGLPRPPRAGFWTP